MGLIGLSLPTSSFTALGAVFFSVFGCVAGAVVGGAMGQRSMSVFCAFAGTGIFAVAAACMSGVLSGTSRALISLWAENPKIVAQSQPQVDQGLKQLIKSKMTQSNNSNM